MGKRKAASEPSSERPLLPRRSLSERRRQPLVLPRYLIDEAEKNAFKSPEVAAAHEILKKWAQLEASGDILRKETSVDADFLIEVFSRALGYRTFTAGGQDYELERQFSVPGVGTADGALGQFTTSGPKSPRAVIELKDAGTDLDRDKSAARTPVQQCWDYLNALPECPWGIVSNFVTLRLYHRDRTPLVYEEFRLRDLVDDRRFRQFYCLLSVRGLVRPPLAGHPPYALGLMRRSQDRQREVGDKLYEQYSDHRSQLIEHLVVKHRKPLDSAIRIAQKLLDRIIFIAFCEDRGLLPEKCIDHAYSSLPPFSKVTNPRWRNFLDLFHAIDQGHERFDLKTGYDGGLFEHDPEVDDLQLEDSWTRFFHNVGSYDFRDEVQVDVLGHLFEKSITELERIRTSGLFAPRPERARASNTTAVMPKSAARKRLGVYYTPSEFTRFLVEQTVEPVIDARWAAIRERHGLTADDLDAAPPDKWTASCWRDCLTALKEIKVCDPACGSGAFLIQAYEVLEARYLDVAEHLDRFDHAEAVELDDQIPDLILHHNLFGVDLSPQAVEIAQLALWLRSARRGKTLADLSANIVCGNSLVADRGVDPRALDWKATFPAVFAGDSPGFDGVVGNPPWERLKLQEREFFAHSAPEIANAVNAATRRRLIAALETKQPELYASYLEAKGRAESTLAHVRSAGAFPLTATGDINTYAVFAELARKLVAPHGRVGLLVPSGIATDNTTKEFFAALIESQSLICLYDFENKAAVFPDVHRSFKFCTLVFGGSATRQKSIDFAFFLRSMDDAGDLARRIKLSAADLRLMNPNTRTCPIFRTRRDADLTRGIYQRVPVLIDHGRREGGNPWGIRFLTMFHQTNDAELFHAPADLAKSGYALRGNRWVKGKRTYLPLYEAKMIQAFDHRAASVVIEQGNWVRQGQTAPTSLVSHQNPEFVVQPRWWVDETEVRQRLGGLSRPAYLAYKDVTSPTNRRTMIAALMPCVGVVNSAPLVLCGEQVSPRLESCLVANLNSYVLDFVARQKVGGVHLNFFIVEQLPLLPPDAYAERCPWQKNQTLERWISDRVLKLSCTANDMRPLAEAADFAPQVHKWNPAERSRLLAELDAAYFRLYGVERDDVEYILSTFQGADEADGTVPGLYAASETVLEAYDRLSSR